MFTAAFVGWRRHESTYVVGPGHFRQRLQQALDDRNRLVRRKLIKQGLCWLLAKLTAENCSQSDDESFQSALFAATEKAAPPPYTFWSGDIGHGSILLILIKNGEEFVLTFLR